MLMTVPLRPVPSQQFDIVLSKQPCTIRLYQKLEQIYLDLAIGGIPCITGALCRDRMRIVQSEYLGFIGDLYFVDQEGGQDPQYVGLGSRWLLMHEVSS